MAKKYSTEEVDTTDGVKIYIGKEWVHLRKSNTEPIIRIYSESASKAKADKLAEKIIQEINALLTKIILRNRQLNEVLQFYLTRLQNHS